MDDTKRFYLWDCLFYYGRSRTRSRIASKGASWTFPTKGMLWSLIAGIAGAAGAFCVLLAFGARGTPPVVMSLVFGGAPVVNAIASMVSHPPARRLAEFAMAICGWNLYSRHSVVVS